LAGSKIFGAEVKNSNFFPVETFSARFFCDQNIFPRKNFGQKHFGLKNVRGSPTRPVPAPVRVKKSVT